MFMRAFANMRLRSWLGHSDQPRKRIRLWCLIPTFVLGIAGLVLFYIYALPHLLRLRFHMGLSPYDLGFYGLGPSRRYYSFDEQSPITQSTPSGGLCDERYTFLSPRGDSVEHPGPMIIDADGELVWMKHNRGTTQDFKVQQYKGQDYVTYWQGDEEDGYGHGSWYMLDSTYTPKYTISPVGDLDGDLHDIQITVNDTAILSIYEPIPYDLTSIGGPELGWLYDGVVQEIDIESGELLFEWRSSTTYLPEASFLPLDGKGHERTRGYDYFHLNSVEKDNQGRYLVSSRHTHTITCIDSSGEVLWILGGKQNNFTDLSDGAATSFAWQHDARWQGPNTITLFNNAATGAAYEVMDSHGLLIELDIPAREAKVLTKYEHPLGVMSVSQGNLQVLDTGNVLVGWGHSAAFTEYTLDGELVCDTHFGASAYFNFGRIVSYRVFKGSWVGTPDTLPDAAMIGESVFVSWNGATEVSSWVLEAWDADDFGNMTFVPVHSVPRSGFETEIPFPPNVKSHFRVAAVDARSEVLGRTEIYSWRPASPEHLSFGPPLGVMVILIFSLACLVFGLYYAVTRRRSHMRALYEVVRSKEDDDSANDGERDHQSV